NQVIEHVPDPIALLKLVRGRLRPGGRVVLAFPNTASLNKRVTGRRWINWHIPYHLHHYNSRSFAMIAEQAGYWVISMQTITPNVWTILQMQAMLRRTSQDQPAAAWADSKSGAPDSAPATTRKRLVAIAHSIIAPFNRIVDSLGWGDSLLVELR